MRLNRLIACLCVVTLLAPLTVTLCHAGDSSSYWSNLVHQENSITASLLYIPYLIFMVPVRVIDGVIDPKPTSQATVPPAAHKVAP
jgi:hypothetical protein